MRVTEGAESTGTIPSAARYANKEASIVHVDRTGRLATLRKGGHFEDGAFLIVKDSGDGQQTGVLKALPSRAIGLRTADVLEGEPDINDVVFPASATEAERLAKIYRDPEQ